MSTELYDALARAAEDGRASFELRGAEEWIAPATRRARRQRAAMSAVAGVGAAAVIGGMLWAVDAAGWQRPQPVEGSFPTAASTGSGHDTAGDPPAGPAWTAADLTAIARPRFQDQSLAYSTAGMICSHERPSDDPRIGFADSDEISHAQTIVDCSPVWFPGSAAYLTASTVSVSTSDSAGGDSLSYSFELSNQGSWPVSFDTDSLFIWIETEPRSIATEPSLNSKTLLGASMWSGAGTVTALLDSSQAHVTVDPGGHYSGAITVQAVSAEDGLHKLIVSDTPFRITLWGRIHEESPTGSRTVLVQLGTAYDKDSLEPSVPTLDLMEPTD